MLKLVMTPRRMALGLAPAFLVAAGLVALAAPASADPGCGVQTCGGDDGGSSGGSGDGTITVLVWGSGTTNGGEGYDIPAESVGVTPPCYYFDTDWTGEYYATEVWPNHVGNADGPEAEPFPNYEQYAEETEGSWWASLCDSGNFDGSTDEFFDYADGWFAEHDPVYVFPNEDPPETPIPPEILVQVAYDELTLPDPQVGWNPRRDGDAATFVNLDTWMWLDDGPVQLEVNAEAGGNTARVEATLGSMTFSAPTANTVTCQGGGVEWSPGAASTDCALVFNRSSASQPGQVTQVTAQSSWAIEWFANGEPRGPLDPQTTTSNFDIPVAEVQTVVNGTGD